MVIKTLPFGSAFLYNWDIMQVALFVLINLDHSHSGGGGFAMNANLCPP